MSSSFVEVTTGDVSGGDGGDVVSRGGDRGGSDKRIQEGPSGSVVKGSVGWMNRSEVRKRVYAGMTPGQKRAKHIIAGKEFDMEGRQWIWDYWNNYKAASVFFSMFGIFLCLVSTVFMLSAKGAYIEGRTDYWSFCDWTRGVQCSPVWTSEYAYAFGLISPPTSSSALPEEDGDDSSSSLSSSLPSWISSLSIYDFILIPNDMYLILFYIAQIVLSEKRGPRFVKYQLALSALALTLALWMASAIIGVLGLLACPMGVVQFGVNSALALANITRWRALRRLEVSKKA